MYTVTLFEQEEEQLTFVFAAERILGLMIERRNVKSHEAERASVVSLS